MINYFFLEYFRNLSGLTETKLSAACGKTDETGRKYYSNHLKARQVFPDEYVQAMADAMGIIPEWITQSPAVLSKQDLDNYIEQNEKNDFALVEHAKKATNQYLITSRQAAKYLFDFAEKERELSQHLGGSSALGNKRALEDYGALVKQSFLPDPEYVSMPLRPMIEYADAHYDDIPSFVRAFASQYPDTITKSSSEALIRKLATAPTIPTMSVSNKVMECFASFANMTLDRVFCDFSIKSDESVFNLFLVTSISLSGWSITDDEDTGDTILTLTNPKFLPSAKTVSAPQSMTGMPPDFAL